MLFLHMGKQTEITNTLHNQPTKDKQFINNSVHITLCGLRRDAQYLLIIYNAWADLRSLVTWCALNSQSPLMEGLSRNSIVRQFNVD